MKQEHLKYHQKHISNRSKLISLHCIYIPAIFKRYQSISLKKEPLFFSYSKFRMVLLAGIAVYEDLAMYEHEATSR
jgi:hypothetical protein